MTVVPGHGLPTDALQSHHSLNCDSFDRSDNASL